MIEQAGAPVISISFRSPSAQDGPAVHGLIRAAGGLDLNSRYCYLLLCSHFAPTCVLARVGDELAGYVSAYREPESNDTLFVWQVAVAPAFRGRGVARAMLDELLTRPACAGVRFIEATVSPGNAASRALFASLARRLGAPLLEKPGFPPSVFLPDAHEAEPLLRIGPLALLSTERSLS